LGLMQTFNLLFRVCLSALPDTHNAEQ